MKHFHNYYSNEKIRTTGLLKYIKNFLVTIYFDNTNFYKTFELKISKTDKINRN